MQIRGTLSKGLLVALVLSLIPAVASSAQKVTAGAVCKTLKQKVTYGNKVYTCSKSGKKLVWSKGVAIKKPTSIPTSTPTPKVETLAYVPSSQPSSNIELCKTKESSSPRAIYENSLPTGFPRSNFNFATKSGTVKWALVPLDFIDIPGDTVRMV